MVHPGGPLWSNKDRHAWSLPKGEFEADEEPLAAAQREFAEETGFLPDGKPISLGSKKHGGKTIYIWAVEGNCDIASVKSNSFEMEWPPRSGRMGTFPEVDRAGWFDLIRAREKIHKNQVAFIDALEVALANRLRKDAE